MRSFSKFAFAALLVAVAARALAKRDRKLFDCCPATLGTGDPRWRHDRRRLYDPQ